jgi:large subunit ribosomal protein L9
MEVILRQDIEKVGHRGQVVKVADGFARNYLLPKRLAVAATEANRKIIEQERQAHLRRETKEKSDAADLATMLEGLVVTLSRKAGDQDQLFGSVTPHDLSDALAAQGLTIDRRKIHLDQPIRQLGEHHVTLRLHRDVAAVIRVQVNREE